MRFAETARSRIRAATQRPDLSVVTERLATTDNDSKRAYVQAAYLCTLVLRVMLAVFAMSMINYTLQQFTQPSENDVMIACIKEHGQYIGSTCVIK